MDMQKILDSMRSKKEIGEKIYLLFFAVAVGSRAIGWFDDGALPLKSAFVICIFLFMCKIIVTKHTVKEYVLIGSLMLLAGLVYLNTGERGLFLYFMMMLGVKNIDSRKIIRCGVVVAGLLILYRIFTGAFGIMPEIYYPQTRDGAGTMFRHALGYAHPNTLHMNVIMLTMMVMYLVTFYLKGKENSRKILFAASIAAVLFNLYVFSYSGSRTGLLACVVYVVINYYLFIRKKLGLFEKIVGYAAFPLASFISIVLPHILPENLFNFFNWTVFNSRFGLAKYFCSNNGLSLFGIRLFNPEESYRTYGIDMSQLYLFLQLGLVAFVVMFVLTTFFVNRCIADNKKEELSVMLTMLFIGLWEPLLYNVAAKDFAYVFMGSAIYSFLEGAENKRIESQTGQDSENKSTASQTGQVISSEKILDNENEVTDNSLNSTGKDDIKYYAKRTMVAVVVGVVAIIIYVVLTKEPSALYGARQEGENGVSFGMEPGYYTSEQIDEFEENGDIVLDYAGEKVPMYKYDEDLAIGEYHKKTISVGVWSGIFFVFLYCFTIILKKKRIKNEKKHQN